MAARSQLKEMNRRFIKAGLRLRDQDLINKRVRHQEFMLKLIEKGRSRAHRQSSRKKAEQVQLMKARLQLN